MEQLDGIPCYMLGRQYEIEVKEDCSRDGEEGVEYDGSGRKMMMARKNAMH